MFYMLSILYLINKLYYLALVCMDRVALSLTVSNIFVLLQHFEKNTLKKSIHFRLFVK